MALNDIDAIASLYSNITKKVEPASELIVQHAPLLNNTQLSTEQALLEAVYTKMEKKCICKDPSKKNKKFSYCEEKYSKKVNEAKKGKPDYMDVDKDGNKKESMKKALKDKAKHPVKEQLSSFKELFNKVISEKSSPFSPEPINPHLDSDRKKLEKMRKEKEEAKKEKAKK